MREYILAIDTETSGIPEDLQAPYASGKWPYIVQLAWVVFNREGEKVKVENHYIQAKDFKVDPESIRIHGITEALLEKVGEQRPDVLQILYNDILHYDPLIVGHFMEFDNHMLEVSFRRAGIENAARSQPQFCTMRASKVYNRHILRIGYLRLDELYHILFNKKLEKHHDALVDAQATGECFFEMMRRKDIDAKTIIDQQTAKAGRDRTRIIAKDRLILWVIIFIILIAIVWIAF